VFCHGTLTVVILLRPLFSWSVPPVWTLTEMKMSELIVGAASFAILAILLISQDGFEALHEFTRNHESWELDEVILLVTAAMIAALITVTLTARRKTNEVLIAKADLQKRYEDLDKIKDELADANRHKAQFLGLASHELRTPLNAIIGFAQVLGDDRFKSVSDEQRNIYLRDIEEAGLRLLQQVNGMLQLASVESKEFQCEEGAIDLVLLLDTCLDDFSGIIQDRSLTVTFDKPEEPVTVCGDVRLIRQVFFNLISNAVKFAPESGAVALEIEHENNGKLTVSVLDNGDGIPEETVRLLLEPYGQSEFFPKMTATPSGFGLPISAAAMRLLGGDLRLSRRTPKGTTASVIFPAVRVL